MHKTLLTAALLALAAGTHAADELTNSGINNPFEGYVHGKNQLLRLHRAARLDNG